MQRVLVMPQRQRERERDNECATVNKYLVEHLAGQLAMWPTSALILATWQLNKKPKTKPKPK